MATCSSDKHGNQKASRTVTKLDDDDVFERQGVCQSTRPKKTRRSNSEHRGARRRSDEPSGQPTTSQAFKVRHKNRSSSEGRVSKRAERRSHKGSNRHGCHDNRKESEVTSYLLTSFKEVSGNEASCSRTAKSTERKVERTERRGKEKVDRNVILLQQKVARKRSFATNRHRRHPWACIPWYVLILRLCEP